MIKTVRVDISAGNPETPLGDFVAFVGSAISFTLINIPRELGKRVIERVAVEMRDNQGIVRSFEAERVGSAWGATVSDDFFTHPCYVKNGVKIVAFGKGNNGEDETWTIGQGDITIIENSVTIQPNDEIHELLVVDGEYLNNPKRGYFDIAGMRVFDGNIWVEIGGGGAGATVLTVGGGKIYNGGVELTSYAALLALVQAGGVTLMGTVGADKDALYYPLFCDVNAIRFDATGTLGGDVKTKSYTVQPVNGDHIRVSEGTLVDLAKKSDIPTSIPWGSVTGKPSVFPPESHSHAQSEVTGLEAALAGKLDKASVVPPSYAATIGQAADAHVVGYAFKAFFGNGNDDFFIDYSEGYLRFISPNLGSFKVKVGNGDRELADITKLSGITAQDIADFLTRYKGDLNADFTTQTIGTAYEKGDICSMEDYYVVVDRDVEKGPFPLIGWIVPYAPTDGFLRLIDLFGESNSQMVSTIEAKAVKVLAYEKREGDDKEYLYDGDTKLTSYAKFLALVQSGRVVLRATATPSSGSSPVLFRPQLMNGNVVLFDATGEISEVMRTRNIQVKRQGTDGIEVVSGGLKQIALITDISATNATFKAAVEAVFDNADTTEY